jgi:outer membrane protein OmpA-like peptidoglycan-associated protein
VGTVVSVQIPKMFPFDDVTVTEGPSKILSPTAAVTELPAAHATLVSARRADAQLVLRLRIVADDVVRHETPAVLYQDVYFFDPQSKRKYSVLKDTDGNLQAAPTTDRNSGGRWSMGTMQPKAVTLMSLTMQAPPDSVVAGDLVIPGFLPIEGLVISGAGGAAESGAAASGRSVGFEAALKELNAAVTATSIAINLSADLLFDFDRADLKATSEESLQNLLAVVKEKGTASVTVIGHTDLRGEEAYNTALSERRATAVKTWLVSHGIPATRVAASGAGESRPLRSGDTEDAHQANRRVEIRVAN